MNDHVVDTIITIAGWLVAAGAWAWALLQSGLKSYFSEKFKNMAAKEDIASLTVTIQSVQLEFSSALARLQSNLELVRGHETRVADAEFDALLTFHKSAVHHTFFVIPELYRRGMSASGVRDLVPHLEWFEERRRELREHQMLLRAFATRQPQLAKSSHEALLTIHAIDHEVLTEYQEYLRRWATVPLLHDVPEPAAYTELSSWWLERTKAPLEDKLARALRCQAAFADGLASYTLARTA